MFRRSGEGLFKNWAECYSLLAHLHFDLLNSGQLKKPLNIKDDFDVFTQTLRQTSSIVRGGFHFIPDHESFFICPRNYADLVRLLDIAAALGNPAAHYSLGQIYSQGEITPKDPHKAFVHNLEAARHGYEDAQYRVAWSYAYGVGVAKSHTKAIAILKKQAAKGQQEAKGLLCDFYLGRISNRVHRFSEALRILQEIAGSGHDSDYRYTFLLGQLLVNGCNGIRDYEAGMELIYKAFDHGNQEATRFLANGLICGNIPCPHEATFICEGCGLIRYCSQRCQSRAWKSHSTNCNSVEERLKFEKYREFVEAARDFYELGKFQEAEKSARNAVATGYSHFDRLLGLEQGRFTEEKLKSLIDDLEAHINSPRHHEEDYGAVEPNLATLELKDPTSSNYLIL